MGSKYWKRLAILKVLLPHAVFLSPEPTSILAVHIFNHTADEAFLEHITGVFDKVHVRNESKPCGIQTLHTTQ